MIQRGRSKVFIGIFNNLRRKNQREIIVKVNYDVFPEYARMAELGRRGRFKTYSSGEGSSPSLGTWVVYSFPETVLDTLGKMWTLPF